MKNQNRLQSKHGESFDMGMQQPMSKPKSMQFLVSECSRLHEIIQYGYCKNCRYFSEGCGSKDKDGICKYQGLRPTTRFGVLPGIWSHVSNQDVCVIWKRATSKQEINDNDRSINS
jgi:hypothetical protein